MNYTQLQQICEIVNVQSDEKFPDFPTFTPFFEKGSSSPVPLHLTLLNLNPSSEKTLRLMTGILGNDQNLTPQIVALLGDENWRPHLVGAVAIAMGTINPTTLNALWSAFDNVSWVAPQLAAVASIVDPEFDVKARLRLKKFCPLETKNWHSAKIAATLVALLKNNPQSTWLSEYLNLPEAQNLIAADRDNSGDLATNWLSSFQKLKKEISSNDR